MSGQITSFSQEYAFLSNFYPVPGGVQLTPEESSDE